MAKNAQSDFRKILADIKKGQFAPVYLLSGEEPYFLDRIADALSKRVVHEDEADFNLDVYYGIETDVETVANAARQFPVLAERRLVMLKELQTMQRGKQQLEKLIPYFRNPSGSTVLVIVFKGEAIPATSKVAKAVVEGGGVTFQGNPLRDYELEAFIMDYATQAGVEFDRKAAAMLGEFIGSDIEQLITQISKLRVSLPKGSMRITPELVERNIGISKDYNNYEFVAALARRDFRRSMQISVYFQKDPKNHPLTVTIGVLFRFFAQLMIAYYSTDKTQNGLMKALGLKSPYALRDISAAMPNYSAASCVRIIRALRDCDAMSKGIGSLQSDSELLRELVFKIFTL